MSYTLTFSSYPAFLKRVGVRYLELGLGLVLLLALGVVLEFRVKARVKVKVRAEVRDSWGTKRLDTKRLGLGYEMYESRTRLPYQ